ncbi:MAG: hypothetical protein V1895_01165 [Parcubacteria group bacterium]
MNSGPTGQMMAKKVGGKMTIGQYFSFQKMYYMWLVIAAAAVAVLSVFGWGIWLSWLVSLYAAFVYFWFGYQLVKMHRGEMKDALIGGAVLGVLPSLLMGIGFFIYFAFIFKPLGFLGISVGGYGVGYGIGQLVGWVVGGAIGGLVMSLIGYAVAGGFSKPGAAKTV